MSACNVDPRLSANAIAASVTRERFRDVLYREFEATSELVELLQRLPRGVETASAVHWNGTVYVGVTYRGEPCVWKVRASSIRSVPVPSFELYLEVQGYIENLGGLDPEQEQTAAALESLARTLCAAIRKEIFAHEDSDDSPILLVTVDDECLVLTRELVIGSLHVDSMLLM